MTRKLLKWLVVPATLVGISAMKLAVQPEAQRNAVYDAVAGGLEKVAGAVADNTGLADPSQGTLTALLKAYIGKQEADTWCLNSMKIKSAKTDKPIGLMALRDLAQDQNAGSVSTDIFPVIFAEEAFIKWSEHDAFVMALLIGGKYIAVHSGGYPHSVTAPGNPGSVYDAKDFDQVIQVIDVIRSQGAVVDLTDKGRKEGVWDPKNGFCLQGFWQLKEVTGWTTPAADNEGKIVTHIKATVTFQPTAIGAAKGEINPIGTEYTAGKGEFVAAKFNDGWRLIHDQ